MSIVKRGLAEFIGTFWLVFGGIGSAVIAANFVARDGTQTILGIGFVGVSLAVGLTVMVMAYTIGHISGCHINPAVSLGLLAGGRFKAADLPVYLIAQVLGAIAGGGLIYMVASGRPGFSVEGGMGSNGYDKYSPGGYSMVACFIAETVLTFMFLLIIMGATDKRAPKGFAPIAIGLGLTGIHLIGIPITNLSVNPARSTGTAVFVGGWAISQLWLFWLAPIIGGILGGLVYRFVFEAEAETV